MLAKGTDATVLRLAEGNARGLNAGYAWNANGRSFVQPIGPSE